ncbi:biotin/lipoyl-containing protein [Geofilum sp. OHC36d9]|uniref:biotin/lipoyl-containing protein n=1 Tax=Geofilum sp. OHC36d9 TaxID=3458413 RepID=UPI004033620E
MKMIVKNGKKEKTVRILNKEGNLFTVAINEKEYQLDVVRVENGVYSILYNGQSINMEMIEGDTAGSYKVNTLYDYFELEIAPALNQNVSKRSSDKGGEQVKSPMSGKIVKVKIREGDRVDEGTPLVILSAMKMENEIRSTTSGIVSKIAVKEDDLVKDGQLMISIKEAE